MAKLLASFVIAVTFVPAICAEPPRSFEYLTIAVNSPAGGTLASMDRKPKLLRGTEAMTEWNLRETDKGWTIRSEKSATNPESLYLGIDMAGKVKLVAKPGEGTYWKINLRGEHGTIQASGGKFDGWYLGFSDKGQQLKDSDYYKTYQPELSEKSGARTKLHIFLDGK